MSDTINNIQNDYKDVEKSNIPEQASADITIHMHAAKAEEKNVCGNVLHTKEEHSTRRGKLTGSKDNEPNKHKAVFGQNREYIVNVGYDSGRTGEYPSPGRTGEYPSQGRTDYDPLPPVGLYVDELPGERNAFIRKVMIILLFMLLITGGFMFTVAYVKPLNNFFNRFWIWIMIPSLIIVCVIACIMPYADWARRPPTNYLCLVIVTIFESLWLAALTAHYNPHLLVMAFLATAAVVFVCFLLACTRFDFTKWYLIVVAVSSALGFLALMVTILMYVFNIHLKIVIILLLVCLTLTNVVMLVTELQMILGGKTVELSIYDYALGALLLYMTIITIFLNLLQIMGAAESSS